MSSSAELVYLASRSMGLAVTRKREREGGRGGCRHSLLTDINLSCSGSCIANYVIVAQVEFLTSSSLDPDLGTKLCLFQMELYK